jgi:hypothetical protein
MKPFNNMSLLSLRKFDPEDVILVSSCPETPPIEISEPWKRFGSDILNNSQETFRIIQETREDNSAKAMKLIQRVLMQMHQRSRDTSTKGEKDLIEYKGCLCLEALKIEAPMENLKTIKQIMKSIESTYISSNEYLILKAEILVRTREWREEALAINGTGTNKEVMKEE